VAPFLGEISPAVPLVGIAAYQLATADENTGYNMACAEDPTICIERDLIFAAAAAKAKQDEAGVRSTVETMYGESLRGHEYFIHGTTAEVAKSFQWESGKVLYMTKDLATAKIFAQRTVDKAGGDERGGVVLVLEGSTVIRLRSSRLLIPRQIDDMPGHWEWVFQPGAKTIVDTEGVFMPLPRGVL
jgi:hypothetical protein